jgi:hypothetical protein
MRATLRDLPGTLRLAIGCFCAMVLGFALLAQVNLMHQVGDGSPAGPDEVLAKYHGAPDGTLLHEVLDLALPADHPQNMSQFLGGVVPDDAITTTRRALILGWVEAGAQESGWSTVAPIFTGFETCGACHAEGRDKDDLPFETYEQVLVVARPGEPTPLGPLLISAHNHLFGFAVLAGLLSVALCFSRVVGTPRIVLVLAASGGATLDITGWFLTRSFGSPFHLCVMAGGGLFGLSTTIMALLVLRDVVAGPGETTTDA